MLRELYEYHSNGNRTMEDILRVIETDIHEEKRKFFMVTALISATVNRQDRHYITKSEQLVECDNFEGLVLYEVINENGILYETPKIIEGKHVCRLYFENKADAVIYKLKYPCIENEIEEVQI